MQVGSWEFDIQRFAGLAKGRTLTSVTKKALRRLGLMKYFKRQQLDAFLQEMEALYKENDYHCNVHAADVVQAAFVMLSKVSCCATRACGAVCNCMALVVSWAQPLADRSFTGSGCHTDRSIDDIYSPVWLSL